MNLFGLIVVGIGAMLGAWLRWGVSALLNPLFPTLPLGTLTANLLGGYLIGIAIALFPQHTSWPPEMRLLIVTGFLGALTTFSTFSAEVVDLFFRSRYLWGVATAGAHLFGALAMTVLGIYSVILLARS